MSHLNIIRVGLLLSGAVLLTPTAGRPAVVQPAGIAVQSAVTTANGPITLQYKTSLTSSTWLSLETFSGATNVSFANLPAVFIRGVCTNPTVSVALTWPASSDPSVAGYKVYYGTASGIYTNSINVGNATTATISNLVAGTRYYFAATAYNGADVESPYSIETNIAFKPGFSLGISGFSRTAGTTSFNVAAGATKAVAIPLTFTVITKKITAAIGNPITLQFTTNLAAPTWQLLGTFAGTTNVSFTNMPAVFIRGYCTNLATKATLAWQPSNDPNVTGYNLYYGTTSHDYSTMINTGTSTMATVSNLVAGATYYFAVTAYNADDVQSPLSNEASGSFQVPFSLAISN